jgi:hypothetical protein
MPIHLWGRGLTSRRHHIFSSNSKPSRDGILMPVSSSHRPPAPLLTAILLVWMMLLWMRAALQHGWA